LLSLLPYEFSLNRKFEEAVRYRQKTIFCKHPVKAS
jgi:hypothetical protein